MKQIIERIKSQIRSNETAIFDAYKNHSYYFTDEEARKIVDALEGKIKLPIIQRIQDRTTEEEKQLAEQIAEEAIAKINWVSVEDSAAPLGELVWAYDVRGMVVQAIRYGNDEKIITEVSSGENFTYSHWMTYVIPTAPEIEIHL